MLDRSGYQDDQGYILQPRHSREGGVQMLLKSNAVVGRIPCDICFRNGFVGSSPLRTDELTGIILAR
jgi:hypothetical protein